MADKKRLLVLGAGPGGYPAAFLGADEGLEVTLVDLDEQPGGVCLHRGCIPSKALLHIAKVLTEIGDAERFGVKFGAPELDITRMRDWKNSVVHKMTGGLGVLAKARKVRQIAGRGRFTDDHHVLVELNSGGAENVEFDYAVVATGSTPIKLGALLPESDRVWDSTAALELKTVPKSLLVIGGGYIGLELGSVYSALGAAVTVVEATDGLLPGADRDLVDVLEGTIRRRFHQVLLNTKVVEAREVESGIEVKMVGLDLTEPTRIFDAVLVSVGRRPSSADIGIAELGIELDDRGFVKIDGQRRTAVPHIFAIGDVAGQPMLAHKATYEARIAIEAMLGKPTAYDPQAIPAVVFTDPELAWAGITETEARTHAVPHKVTRFPWAASGRATTLARNDGLTKMILDPQTERILGMGIVGVGAGEMIAEGVLAIEMGAQATDIMMSIHAHPTLSETVMEAAELHYGASAHMMNRGG